MNELSDAEVMTAPAPSPQKEMSDAEVMSGPPVEAGVSAAAMPAIRQAVEPVLNAFGQGFREGWGPDRLGLPDADVQALSKAGIFAPTGADRYTNPFHAFNELLAETIWRVPEVAFRGMNAVFRGGQAAVAEAGAQAGQPGLGRDIAAIPEAFFGSPHPLGIPKTMPEGVPLKAGEAARESNVPRPPEDAVARAAESTATPKAAEPPPVDLAQARDLGVIGAEKPPITEGTPVAAARNAVPDQAMAAGRTVDPADVVKGPDITRSATDKAGNIRLDLIDKPEDVLSVIRQAAEENGGSNAFSAARQGDIPLAQVDALSEATGMRPEDMDVRGMGRLMRNDNEVRSAIQAMIQSAEDTSAAMKKAAATDAPEDLIEFQRLRMRHSVLQEQVAGLTAEWGRTGNVFQEFSERAKDAKGLGEFLKDKKGETLDDLREMAKAGSVLDRGQMAKFLNDSRRA